MSSVDPSVYDEIERRVDQLEALVRKGHVDLAPALRRLTEFSTLVHEFSDGETFGWGMLSIVAPLIEALEHAPVPPPDELARRRRP